ncbi:MAG TPA: hypothetical protein VEH52_10880 [Gaiellaceae bacterium]|jgi:hypothetical protein|nr:hypothetical protein [Gaiellaceae bacterium]
MRTWGPTLVVVFLLAGTAVAFATTERQKLETTPFSVIHVDQTVSPKLKPATIRVNLRHEHLLTVQIVNAQDHAVATLARDQRFDPGVATFHWTPAVPDGTYRPRITIEDGRVFVLQNPIRVDSIPPRITVVSYHPRVVRRTAKPHVIVVYKVSEFAHAILYADGRKVAGPGYGKNVTGRIEWITKQNGQRLGPGTYRLQLAAVDLAGNVGPRTHAFVVRLR